MRTALFLSSGLLLAVVLGMVIIPRILVISHKKRLYDIPDARKVHTTPIPRLGGLSFFPVILMSLFLVMGLYLYMDNPDLSGLSFGMLYEFLFLFVGMTLLYLVGVCDDLVGVGYRYKFLVQILAAALLTLSGNWLGSLGGLLGVYAIPAWVGVPLTLFVVVYITNAINLIDGIDGLASGLCCIALSVLGLVFLYVHQPIYALLAICTFGVLIPFWCYNVFGNAKRGHKLFMGDAGSLTLGYVLSFLVIRLSVSEQASPSGPNPYMVGAGPAVRRGARGAAPPARAQEPVPAGQEPFPPQAVAHGHACADGDGDDPARLDVLHRPEHPVGVADERDAVGYHQYRMLVPAASDDQRIHPEKEANGK